jgi:4-amino-4-deoxy-L-arabinose transferase-like glycosyltransferase
VTWVFLAVTVLLGVTTRVVGLGTLPPGLYHDEAVNGLDALRVIGGERPIFFEANNGREPLFLYVMAATMAWLGRTPTAVRLPAVILGSLTVPATFWMARAMFGERVGLWSAFWMAVAPWPINLSRIGLRAVSMPLVVALGLGAWWTGRRRQGWARAAWVSLGGALLGLSVYTYTAARLVLPAVALFVLYQWSKYGWQHRIKPDSVELLCLFLAAAVVMAPLLAYAVAHWDAFAERSAQVSLFNPAIGGDRPWKLLAGNLFRAAGLFFVRGDRILRHNIPHRPLYDPLAGVFFMMGVLLCTQRALPGKGSSRTCERDTSSRCCGRKGKGSGGYALALIWTGAMLIPTILAEDCPHFLRAVGVLPVAALFPALGLDWARRRLDALERVPPWASRVGVALVLGVSAAWGLYDYFWRHARDPGLRYAFEADQVQEAVEINRFLGTGWQGEGIAEPAGATIPGRRVHLHPRMWEDRFSVNLLVGSPEGLSILGRPAPDRPPADEVLVLAWPFDDLRQVQQALPHPAEVTVWPGPMERGIWTPSLGCSTWPTVPVPWTRRPARRQGRLWPGLSKGSSCWAGRSSLQAKDGPTCGCAGGRRSPYPSITMSLCTSCTALRKAALQKAAQVGRLLPRATALRARDTMPPACGGPETRSWTNIWLLPRTIRTRSDRSRLVRVEFDATFTSHLERGWRAGELTGTCYGLPRSDEGCPRRPADKGRAPICRRGNTPPARILGLIGLRGLSQELGLQGPFSSHRGGYTCDCYESVSVAVVIVRGSGRCAGRADLRRAACRAPGAGKLAEKPRL